MYLYCKTDRRENPLYCCAPLSLKESNTAQQYKDWNDSGGQRPAIIQVKRKKIKVKRIQGKEAGYTN